MEQRSDKAVRVGLLFREYNDNFYSFKALCQQIKEDWICHGRDWSLPGFRAIAVCRFGKWRMHVRHRFVRAPFSMLYRILYRRVRNRYGIELPYTVSLGRKVIIEHQNGIVIHGNVTIGDECIIRQGVTIGNVRIENPDEAPQLGHRVNIGAGAKLLGNIKIGNDVLIGANAVVIKDAPCGQTVVGVPAKGY